MQAPAMTQGDSVILGKDSHLHHESQSKNPDALNLTYTAHLVSTHESSTPGTHPRDGLIVAKVGSQDVGHRNPIIASDQPTSHDLASLDKRLRDLALTEGLY
jgi:hypothetical protein